MLEETQAQLLYHHNAAFTPEHGLSIVTLQEGFGPALFNLIKSLDAQTCDFSLMEMLIMDGAEAKPDLAAIHGLHPPFLLRYYWQPGMAANHLGPLRQQGIRLAQGAIILFLTGDVIASPRLVQEHLDIHRRNPKPLAVIGDTDHSLSHPEFRDRWGRDSRPESWWKFLWRWIKRAWLTPVYYRLRGKHPAMVISTGHSSFCRAELLAMPDLEKADSDQDLGARLEQQKIHFCWTSRSFVYVQKDAVRGQVDTHTLEIDLTYRCTLHCQHCNRSTGLAPSHPGQDLTLGQVEKLIWQSIENHYPWKRMRLIGGEPTIHPQFEAMLRLFVDYQRRHNPSMVIEVFSNGATAGTQQKLRWVQRTFPEVLVIDSKKNTNRQKSFVLVNLAPVDREFRPDAYPGCRLPKVCGMNLNYAGFFCCSPGGAIARVFGLDIGLKDVGDLHAGKLTDMFNTLCPLCGHYDPLTVGQQGTREGVSPTWQSALESYRQREGREERTRY